VLSRADVRSVRAAVDPNKSQPDILLELTPNGQRKFLGLTTNVARAGRRRHRPVHILISVNGRVISKPYVDYHVSPNPLPYKGIVVDVASTPPSSRSRGEVEPLTRAPSTRGSSI
jgi:hypothetical protein